MLWSPCFLIAISFSRLSYLCLLFFLILSIYKFALSCFLILAIDILAGERAFGIYCAPIPPTHTFFFFLAWFLFFLFVFVLSHILDWESLGGWSGGFLSWIWQRAEHFNCCMGWFGTWDGQLSVKDRGNDSTESLEKTESGSPRQRPQI